MNTLDVTEIRIHRASTPPVRPTEVTHRVVGYANFTISGCFAVRDVRILEVSPGVYRAAMPSRKLADSCRKCGHKTPFVDRFCGYCGDRLPFRDAPRKVVNGVSRAVLYTDVCHALSNAARERIEALILDHYRLLIEADREVAIWPVAIGGGS